ncbi:lipid-A-disaccharide synthase, partial [Vibrio parahaemolyticus]|nr:lipid-A-disaccharide synthase [Vibrio parahaemolyticus]
FTEVSRLLESDNKPMLDKFTEMHHWIRKDADQQAANAVLKLIEK